MQLLAPMVNYSNPCIASLAQRRRVKKHSSNEARMRSTYSCASSYTGSEPSCGFLLLNHPPCGLRTDRMQFNAATASINPTRTEIAELKVPKALPNFGSNKTFSRHHRNARNRLIVPALLVIPAIKSSNLVPQCFWLALVRAKGHIISHARRGSCHV